MSYLYIFTYLHIYVLVYLYIISDSGTIAPQSDTVMCIYHNTTNAFLPIHCNIIHVVSITFHKTDHKLISKIRSNMQYMIIYKFEISLIIFEEIKNN